MLKAVLYEVDQTSFEKLFAHVLNVLLQDPDCKNFGQYFQTYYGNNYKSWAFCYRIGAKINTNGHIESMHRIIKHVYLKKKYCTSLHKSIQILMRFIKDKTFDDFVTMHKGMLVGIEKLMFFNFMFLNFIIFFDFNHHIYI